MSVLDRQIEIKQGNCNKNRKSFLLLEIIDGTQFSKSSICEMISSTIHKSLELSIQHPS